MADSNTTTGNTTPGNTAAGGSEDDDTADLGFEKVRNIGSHLAEEARSAAQTLFDEQKGRAADQVAGVADALRRTARSLDRSNASSFAPYANDAAARVGDFADSMRQRSWPEIADDTEAFARRQPILFIVGAVAAGFIAGRFLTASSERRSAPWRSAGIRPAGPRASVPSVANSPGASSVKAAVGVREVS